MKLNNTARIFLLGGITVLLLVHCRFTPQTLTRPQLVKYINDPDNGLCKTLESNGFTAELKYQPASFFISKQIENEKVLKPEIADSIRQTYNANHYFFLKFSKNGKEAIRQLGSTGQYSDMVQVLSFQMNRFIKITTAAGDTLDLTDYIFDQSYGLSDGNKLLLCFNKEVLEKSEYFNINIAECGFRMGNLRFRFNARDIRRLPEWNGTGR